MSRKKKPEQEEVFGLPGVTPEPAEPGLALGTGLLERSRSAWELGDWAALAALVNQPLETCRDREKLALLAAVGLAQLGQMSEARTYATLARDWGCPTRLMAQVLLGGALNSLGRVASLLGDDILARKYFETSVRTVSPRADAEILGRTRDISEKAALGLLPEAAALMGQSLEHMQARQAISSAEAEIFKSQMGLLNGALALAQKRHQLSPGEVTGGSTGKAPRKASAKAPRKVSGKASAKVSDGAASAAPGLESRALSQLGQDLWVLQQTGHKKAGFFVEFGATDGVLLSNTLLLEAEFGWHGICAEPNPQFFRKLQVNRTCITAPDCIMGQSGRTVEFILADEYGCVAEFADNDAHTAKRQAYRDSGAVIELQSISLDDFLKKYDAPRTIDYLSIDTEGSEYEILKAFPFDDWDVRHITVEHNFAPIREGIRVLLESHGYTRTEMQWDDWYARTPAS